MRKEEFYKYDKIAKEYAEAISEVAEFNYGCEVRTFYKIKPHVASRKAESLSLYKNIQAVLVSLENDRDNTDIYTNAPSVNYMHLAIQGYNVTKEKLAKGLYLKEEEIIDLKPITSKRKRVGYCLKEMNLDSGHNDIFLNN